MHTIDTNSLRNHILHQLGQGATALDAARNWMAAHGIDVDISPADVEPWMPVHPRTTIAQAVADACTAMATAA